MCRLLGLLLGPLLDLVHPVAEANVLLDTGPADRAHDTQRRAEIILVLCRLPGFDFLSRGSEPHPVKESRQACGYPLIWYASYESTPWDRNGSEANRDSPFLSMQLSDLERFSADKDDEDLASNHDDVDDDEENVAVKTLEDVQLVIEASITVYFLACERAKPWR